MAETMLAGLDRFLAEDFDWLNAAGQVEIFEAGATLVEEGKVLDRLYLLLEGQLQVSVSGPQGQPQSIMSLGSGYLAGSASLFESRSSVVSIAAIEPAQVLSLPVSTLMLKLSQDQHFTARFYHTIAIQTSNQLRNASRLLVSSKADASPPLRKVLHVFAELNDSDVDWIVSIGQSLRSTSQRTLIQQGQPSDALYMLLEGTLSVSLTVPDDGVSISKEVARLSTGEMVGEMSFVDSDLPSATVTALDHSWVLGLPRAALSERLEQDPGFASRFYRAIALVLADRLQDRLSHHGYGKQIFNQDQALDEDTEYEDEIDDDLLGSMAKAGMRFDWLIKSLRRMA